MRVHCLAEGRALCGFPPGIPGDWPEGHAWSSVDDWLETDGAPEGRREGLEDCHSGW